MVRDIKQMISQMTLDEKAGLCSGLDFWHTKGVERLGILLGLAFLAQRDTYLLNQITVPGSRESR
jgi:hypothetical protein